MITSRQTAQKLLAELNLNRLPPKKRDKVLGRLEEHFSKVIIATLLSRLSDEQFVELKQALNSANLESEVERIAASVPGLAEAIERRLDEEFKLMKTVMH